MAFMKVCDPYEITDIINKDNITTSLTTEMEIDDSKNFEGVHSEIIPVDLTKLREIRFTEVSKNTTIKAHSHKSPIFRIITSGSAYVNGKLYSKGDWMVIPSEASYEIKTEEGYICLWNCCMCWN